MNSGVYILIIEEIKELAKRIEPFKLSERFEIVISAVMLIRIYMLAGEAIKRIKYEGDNDGFVCEIYNYLDQDFRTNKGVENEA